MVIAERVKRKRDSNKTDTNEMKEDGEPQQDKLHSNRCKYRKLCLTIFPARESVYEVLLLFSVYFNRTSSEVNVFARARDFIYVKIDSGACTFFCNLFDDAIVSLSRLDSMNLPMNFFITAHSAHSHSGGVDQIPLSKSRRAFRCTSFFSIW